jgi:hypothetical protein
MGQKVGSNPRKSANPYDRTPEYRHASGTGVFRIPSAVNVFGMRWLVVRAWKMPELFRMVAAAVLIVS